MRKIGILGGTFNPIHNGHIQMAEYARSELRLDKVIFIPTYTPPHKDSVNLTSEAHRLKMCRIACEVSNSFEVSEIETERKGKSYSCDTLTSLKEIYPEDELYFIMGADMFLCLEKWKNPEIIFEKADIIAIPRNINEANELEQYYYSVLKDMGARAHILPKSVVQVSSTFIRENIEDKNSALKFLNENVYKYIVENNLYRK